MSANGTGGPVHGHKLCLVTDRRGAYMQRAAADARRLMAATGLELEDLAAWLDVKRSTLWRWRTGRVAMPHWAVIALEDWVAVNGRRAA